MNRRDVERLRDNDRSRNKANNHMESWSKDDLDFLMSFWKSEPECEVAEALGRTIEACRQRYYEVRWGCPMRRRTTTTSTTTTTTEYIGVHDDPEDQWWSPDYYK